MEPIIRKATTADIPLIHNLAAIAFPHTYRDILSDAQIAYMMEWMYSHKNLRCQMEEEGHVYYLASLDGIPCGYVSVQQEDNDLFHLQKIYVLPDFQGHRIGKALFRQAISHIRQIHPAPCRMELNVNRQNPAYDFYMHMGMKPLRQGDFDIGNGYYMQDYILGLDLL